MIFFKTLFDYMQAFPLSHACIVTDLTPIVTIDRRVRLPLSQGRGHGEGVLFSLTSKLGFHSNACFRRRWWQNRQNLSRRSLSRCFRAQLPKLKLECQYLKLHVVANPKRIVQNKKRPTTYLRLILLLAQFLCRHQ